MMSAVVFFNHLLPILASVRSFDLNLCKLTHMGTEYMGKLSSTETNVTCQFWSSATQKGSELIENEAFPDGSKILAKNYCRNPNKNPTGPWCFTTQRKFFYDFCNVPLCKSSECRMTGTGMEYFGPIEKSSSGRKCLKWNEPHVLKGKHKEVIFKNKFFPDGSVGKAGRKCRNPNGNIAGPWCYVERGDGYLHTVELCDIPFCDDLALVMYSEGSFSGKYFFFSSINESRFLNISFRIWNPADWLRGELYLFLSAYDIASDRQDIERWNSGVEIIFSHLGTRVMLKEENSLAKTPMILSGAKWTDLEISWINADNQSLLLQVHQKSKQQRPLVIIKILIPNSIFEVESFRYYSLGGSPAFWNIPSSDETCPVHTVTEMNFTRFWLIKKTAPLGRDVEVFVRARADAVIVLRTAPMNKTNQVQLTIGNRNKIRIYSCNNKNHSQQLAETPWPNALNFWKWEYFRILLIRDKLQLFWVQRSHTHLLIEATHLSIEKVMWITFGSPLVSYWTLYCDPRGVADPPSALPPECVTRDSDLFNGTMSITITGQQCIPWTDKTAAPEKYHNDKLFQPYGGRVLCQNFCRNLDNDRNGAYCAVRDAKSTSGFKMEYCHPRSCSLGDCKLAGTANDYVGQLNVTRSKRHCQIWTKIKNDVVTVNNFPDPTLKDAGNFCRNPSKSAAGSWCFTKDKRVPRDLCYIRDCDKPLECTALTSGYARGTLIYILPAWRKHGLQFWLKAWNPDIYEGLIVSLTSLNNSQEYKLVIGDEDGEKLKLFYNNDENSESILLQKTLPHLIPTGKWKGYWLRPGLGKIELGYSGVPTTFFEWESSKKDIAFEPMFIDFGTIKNHWIGINFQCTECLTIQTSSNEGYKIFPINLWRDEIMTSNLYVNLRGTGSAFINLMWTQDFTKLFAIQIMSNVTSVLIIQYNQNKPVVLAVFSVSSTISEHEWSEYIISFTEDRLTLHKDSVHLLEWKSPIPLLFYWFTVTAEGGTIAWTANCPASDIDGKPRDGSWGKWGPWSCSVTCGKGEGKTERVCNDPPPNVFGKECKGSPIYEGPCNDFPCGKISPGTSNIIRHYLSSQHKSLQVDVTERVVLSCNPQAISLITSEVSEMNITWTHNGFPYSRTKFHMDENYSLVIHRAQEKHNGIYLCMAYQDPDSIPAKIVLEVISLVVIKPKPTKKIRKGKSLTLKCNGLALSYVYADLSQRWELNGTVWKDYGLGTLEAYTVDKLENITDSHAGIWTCVIVQEDFKFQWTTNWIYLKVKSAPSFWSHLMEDVATAPLFGKLGNERNAMILFFVLIGAMICIIILVTFFLIKWLKKLFHFPIKDKK